MILRGISTPVQGGDAVNKEYADGLVGNKITLYYNNQTATSYRGGSGDNIIIIIPVFLGSNTVQYYVYAHTPNIFDLPVTRILSKPATQCTDVLFNFSDGESVRATLSDNEIHFKATTKVYGGYIQLIFQK